MKAGVYSIQPYTLISIYMHLAGTLKNCNKKKKVNPSANIPLSTTQFLRLGGHMPTIFLLKICKNELINSSLFH